jgi:peptidoglycan hydrolase-like protein with peptidoglycan-binding domain
MQQPMSMETLTTMSTTSPTTPQATELKTEVTPVATTTTPKAGKLEALPPSGPYKPTNMEIQTALKNANFYIGEVDGKLGPKSKKAVSEFQKANGLTADGKVGPKTWALLSKYLNVDSAAQTTVKSR